MHLIHPKRVSVFLQSIRSNRDYFYPSAWKESKARQNIWNNSVQAIGYQAMRDSDSWETGKNEVSPTVALREFAGFGTGREGPGRAQVLLSWGTEQELPWAPREECQQEKSCRKSSPKIWRVSLTSSRCWGTTQGWGKSHQKGSARTSPRVHTHLEIIPVATAE